MRLGRIILVLPIVLLSACSSSTGLLTGDTQPDAWVKHYCFDGQGAVRASGQPFASGETMGSMKSRGLVVYGNIAPEAQKEIAEQGCQDVDSPDSP